MQGRKATLTVKTSEDVEAITVDGQTIRSYRTRTERMGFGPPREAHNVQGVHLQHGGSGIR